MNTIALLLALAPSPQEPLAPAVAVAPVPPVAPLEPVAVAPVPGWRYATTVGQGELGDVHSARAALLEAERRVEVARKRLAEMELRETSAPKAQSGAKSRFAPFSPSNVEGTWAHLEPSREAAARQIYRSAGPDWHGKFPMEMQPETHAALLRALESARQGSVPQEHLEQLLQQALEQSKKSRVPARIEVEAEVGDDTAPRTRIWIDGKQVELKGDSVLQFRDGKPQVVLGQAFRVLRGADGEERVLGAHALPKEERPVYVPSETTMRWVGENLKVLRGTHGSKVVRMAPEGTAPEGTAPHSNDAEAAPGAFVRAQARRAPHEPAVLYVPATVSDGHIAPPAKVSGAIALPPTPSVAGVPSAQGSPIVEVDPTQESLTRLLEALSGELSALRRDIHDLRQRVEQH